MTNAPTQKGRGTPLKPPNRFERIRCEESLDQLDEASLLDAATRRIATELLPDQSRTIIRKNDSPDLSFRYCINPYRGCEHGCAYCYARPSHEMLGMNSGLDFESKILVKYDAARLLRKELGRPKWRGEEIVLSGVTDCYQPIERKLHITRDCLEVLLEAHQPCRIITKNALVERDLDLLAPMAERNLVHVFLSLTTLDAELARKMEPRTSSPAARLRAIRALTSAGVPVGTMISPIIPGLTDSEIPSLLQVVKEAGAQTALSILLRLPLSVQPIFCAWLDANFPEKKDRVLALIRGTRSGNLSDSRFGSRMRGEGPYAEGIRKTFSIFRKKFGLDQPLPPSIV